MHALHAVDRMPFGLSLMLRQLPIKISLYSVEVVIMDDKVVRLIGRRERRSTLSLKRVVGREGRMSTPQTSFLQPLDAFSYWIAFV
jgi:hypothetical protein